MITNRNRGPDSPFRIFGEQVVDRPVMLRRSIDLISEYEPPDRPEREPRRREYMESQLPRSVSAFHR
jgi:hypothetical protein